jgi:hypothetical protein
MGRIGDFDKDLNPQAWFDETFAAKAQGLFDKSAIGGNEADTQTAKGAPAGSTSKTTRAHDRPLEWWQEAAKRAWESDEKAVARSAPPPTSSDSDWYTAFKAKREEAHKNEQRIPMLPLGSDRGSRRGVISFVPQEDVCDGENLFVDQGGMLSYFEPLSLERAAGIDVRQETYARVWRPMLFAAGGALVVYALTRRGKVRGRKWNGKVKASSSWRLPLPLPIPSSPKPARRRERPLRLSG